MACNIDLFDGLLFPITDDEPNWLATDTTTIQSQKQTASQPHPLLKQSAAQETADDVFDSLDAFLAIEFPELESECLTQSPTSSDAPCWYTNSSSCVEPAVPALSSSSADSQAISALPTVTATCPSAPTPAESALAAAAAAATAQAEAFAMSSSFTSPFSAVNMNTNSMDITRASSITSTGTAAPAAAIPRWKLYHMQQRQELLAPKSKAPKLQCLIPAAAGAVPGAAPASNNSCGSPVSVVSGACMSPPGVALSSASSIGSIAVPQAITAEQLMLYNLHQQQQQQAVATMIGTKRTWPEQHTIVPCAAKKRSRVTAAGNTAAQHLYGLTVEPSQQLQTLQALQLQLQQQIQQNYQQQAEIYQQQQLQALHNQLHLRLAVQQHQHHFQAAPTQVRHKRQTAKVSTKH